VRVPNAVPYLFTALRVAAPLSVIYAYVSEYFGGAQNGLGNRITSNIANSKNASGWAYVAGACLLGLGFYIIANVLERVAHPAALHTDGRKAHERAAHRPWDKIHSEGEEQAMRKQKSRVHSPHGGVVVRGRACGDDETSSDTTAAPAEETTAPRGDHRTEETTAPADTMHRPTPWQWVTAPS
jgi:hypothetical protein